MTIYLADTSVWNRSQHPSIAAAWADRCRSGQLASCAQVRLEVLYSAQSAADYDELADELRVLVELPCGAEQVERALETQRSLAHRGGLHHRSVKIADLLIAASAESGGAVMWHYDEDFDRIAEISGQPMEWAAPRGSL